MVSCPSREYVFRHLPPFGKQGGTLAASVRSGDWKLIGFFEDGHEELYDLKEDIGEPLNLARKETSKRKELSELSSEWCVQVQDRQQVHVTTGKADIVVCAGRRWAYPGGALVP